jgi:hypothetical protein
VAKRFGPAVKAEEPKFRNGQIVCASTLGPSYFCSENGDIIRDAEGKRRGSPAVNDIIAMVVGIRYTRASDVKPGECGLFFGESGTAYLIQVVPSHEINKSPIMPNYFNKHLLFLERRLSYGAREKRLTEAKIYDGKTFYPERIKGVQERIHQDELAEKSKTVQRKEEDR